MMKRLLVIAMSALLSACTSVGAFTVNTSARMFGDYELHEDIAFGTHGQMLDVYIPKPRPQNAPAVVFFYGGGWNAGSKDQFTFVGDALTSRGYIAVIADYRKYPQVKFPEFVDDGAEAVAWTLNSIGEYGGNARNVHLMGHSAGAHLAALLVSDERYLRAVNVQTSSIRSFAGLAGPYSFIPEKQLYKDVFGPPENYPIMHADNFIDGSEPPMLLLAGADDDTVGIFNRDKLEAAIKKHGGKVEVRTYPGLGHIGMITPFTRPLRSTAPLLGDVDRFFKSKSSR